MTTTLSWIRRLFARTVRGPLTPVRRARRPDFRRRPYLESLEDRTLLSGSATPPHTAFAPIVIQQAYNIDSLLAVGNEGQGQTVAIPDLYDWPTATQDLATFCTTFGLPQMDGLNGDPTFTKVDESGKPGSLPPPAPNPGPSSAATEEALDVEWVHAIAPRANIILVEAYLPGDLDSAIATAASLPGVSVVSISAVRPESDGQQNASTFRTPSGHINVTFVAGTGDNGQPGGYPAYSPNVLAVGGTSLTTSPGGYISESGWS
jgi:subtilase family serine protease